MRGSIFIKLHWNPIQHLILFVLLSLICCSLPKNKINHLPSVSVLQDFHLLSQIPQDYLETKYSFLLEILCVEPETGKTWKMDLAWRGHMPGFLPIGFPKCDRCRLRLCSLGNLLQTRKKVYRQNIFQLIRSKNFLYFYHTSFRDSFRM